MSCRIPSRLPGAVTAAVLMLASVGCQRTARTFGVEWTRDERGRLALRPVSPVDRLNQAVASENPDERREGIVWLSHKSRCSLDPVVKLLGYVATQDPDPTVRSAAARALGKSVNPAAIDWLIKAVGDANGYVRLDAAVSLAHKSSDNVKRALLVRLAKDEEAQVRAAAARGLSEYHERRVVEALIAALRDPDFAVVYHAEHSLIRMTGHTYEYDADAWTRWLAGVGPRGDPFAQAGQTPPSLQESRPPLLQRMRNSFRRAWYWWQAAEKPPD